MKDFDKIKVGDIVYKHHASMDMEGWWIVKSKESEYYNNGFKCEVINQRKSPDCENNWCNFTLYENTNDMEVVGTIDDYPEWKL